MTKHVWLHKVMGVSTLINIYTIHRRACSGPTQPKLLNNMFIINYDFKDSINLRIQFT